VRGVLLFGKRNTHSQLSDNTATKGRCILRSTRSKHWYLVGEGTTFGTSIQAREPKKFTATGRKLSANSASSCCVSAVTSPHRVFVGGTFGYTKYLLRYLLAAASAERRRTVHASTKECLPGILFGPCIYFPTLPTVVKLSLRF
jgi:hypothetical protein